MTRRTAYKGATIVEYALIGTTVVGVAIAVVVGLGDNINMALKGLQGDIGTNISAAENAAKMKAKYGDTNYKWWENGDGVGAVVPPPGPGEKQVCFDSGWCVNMPANAQAASATTGAIGNEMVKDYAKLIKQVKNQAEKVKKNAEDNQFMAFINNLSNIGDKLGDTQKNLAQNCPPGSTCVDPTGVMEMAMDTNTLAFIQNQKQLMKYLEKHPDALPPEIVYLLNQNSEEIVEIANAYDATNIITMDDAQTTDTDAANICVLGSGTQCSTAGADVGTTPVDTTADPIAPGATAPDPATQ